MFALCATSAASILWVAWVHFQRVWATNEPELLAIVIDLALAIVPATLAYLAEFLLIWLRRDRLVRR